MEKSHLMSPDDFVAAFVAKLKDLEVGVTPARMGQLTEFKLIISHLLANGKVPAGMMDMTKQQKLQFLVALASTYLFKDANAVSEIPEDNFVLVVMRAITYWCNLAPDTSIEWETVLQEWFTDAEADAHLRTLRENPGVLEAVLGLLHPLQGRSVVVALVSAAKVDKIEKYIEDIQKTLDGRHGKDVWRMMSWRKGTPVSKIPKELIPALAKFVKAGKLTANIVMTYDHDPDMDVHNVCVIPTTGKTVSGTTKATQHTPYKFAIFQEAANALLGDAGAQKKKKGRREVVRAAFGKQGVSLTHEEADEMLWSMLMMMAGTPVFFNNGVPQLIARQWCAFMASQLLRVVYQKADAFVKNKGTEEARCYIKKVSQSLVAIITKRPVVGSLFATAEEFICEFLGASSNFLDDTKATEGVADALALCFLGLQQRLLTMKELFAVHLPDVVFQRVKESTQKMTFIVGTQLVEKFTGLWFPNGWGGCYPQVVQEVKPVKKVITTHKVEVNEKRLLPVEEASH